MTKKKPKLPDAERETYCRQAQKIALEILGKLPDFTEKYDDADIVKRILRAHVEVRAFDIKVGHELYGKYDDYYDLFDPHRIVASAWEALAYAGSLDECVPESAAGERLMLYVAACIAAEAGLRAKVRRSELGTYYFDDGANIALQLIETEERRESAH